MHRALQLSPLLPIRTAFDGRLVQTGALTDRGREPSWHLENLEPKPDGFLNLKT